MLIFVIVTLTDWIINFLRRNFLRRMYSFTMLWVTTMVCMVVYIYM